MISVLILLVILYSGIAYVLSNRVLVPNSSFENTLRDINNYWGTTYEEMMALLPPPTSFTVEGEDGIKNFFNEVYDIFVKVKISEIFLTLEYRWS